jgi:hypothetical protein
MEALFLFRIAGFLGAVAGLFALIRGRPRPMLNNVAHGDVFLLHNPKSPISFFQMRM